MFVNDMKIRPLVHFSFSDLAHLLTLDTGSRESVQKSTVRILGRPVCTHLQLEKFVVREPNLTTVFLNPLEQVQECVHTCDVPCRERTLRKRLFRPLGM